MPPLIQTVNGQYATAVPYLTGSLSIAPLIVEAEASLTITGTGFDPKNACVHVMGITIGDSGDVAAPGDANTGNELTIQAPSVAELQTASGTLLGLNYCYQHNAVLMPITITVENLNTHEISGPVVLGIMLPPPLVGTAACSGQHATIGAPTSGPEVKGTDHLGHAVYKGSTIGEIRWYNPSEPTTQFSFDYQSLLPKPGFDATALLDILKNALTCGPVAIPDGLATLHAKGKALQPTEWSDDGVSFDIPIDPNLGGVGLTVIWRDDLPSAPVPIDINPKVKSINGKSVLALPLLGGFVPLMVPPEAKLVIQYEKGDAGATIRATGVRVVGQSNGCLRKAETDGNKNDLSVYVPSMTELETTDARVSVAGMEIVRYTYTRNALLLPLTLAVVNPNGTRSAPVVVLLRLPPPTIGKPSIDGDLVKIGRAANNRDDTDDLGAPAPTYKDGKPISNGNGGQIRWYGMAEFKKLKLMDGKALAESLTSHLLKGLWENLGQIREAGQWIQPEKGGWHDDSVIFKKPDSPDFGVNLAVIWRDDVPSVPIALWNFSFDCASINQIAKTIEEAAADVWSFLPARKSSPNANSGLTIDTPIPPGEWVPFVTQRIASAADNILAYLLDSKESDFSVKFWFEVSGTHVNNKPVVPDDVRWDATVAMEQSKAILNNGTLPLVQGPGSGGRLCVRIKPQFGPQASTVTVQLHAVVHLPNQNRACSEVDIRIGSPITFQQMSFDIPTLAIFFTGESCGRHTLFVLPPDTRIPGLESGMHLDVNSPPSGTVSFDQELNQYRCRIIAGLETVNMALEVLKDFAPSPMPSWVTILRDNLNALICAGEFVIDTTGYLDDLGHSVFAGWDANHPVTSFGKSIESVLLIGPPAEISGTRFECSDDLGGRDACKLTLWVPAGQFIAGFFDLNNLTKLPWLVANCSFEVEKPEYDISFCAGADFNRIHAGWGGRIASISVIKT